jgi:hypothetical protein
MQCRVRTSLKVVSRATTTTPRVFSKRVKLAVKPTTAVRSRTAMSSSADARRKSSAGSGEMEKRPSKSTADGSYL